MNSGLSAIMNKQEFIEEIEFFTSYPNKEGSRTILTVALTNEGHRVLCYIPSASVLDLSLDESTDWDIKHTPLRLIQQQRRLRISGELYGIHDHPHNEGKWFVRVIELDGPINPIEVDKADIEKLFGCKING